MDELLQAMRQYAEQNKVPILESESAALLTAAVSARQPKAVLEIGTAIGYSTLVMARQMPEDGLITTLEISAVRAAVAEEYVIRSGYSGRINLIRGDAANTIPALNGSFDFVFIDAAKGQYLNYLQALLDKLSPGAIIFADNILFRGWVNGGSPPRRYKTIVERLRQYIDFVTGDPRFTTTIYPVGDGVAVSEYGRTLQLEKT
jgi:predicted O-methyltransferase YrrM